MYIHKIKNIVIFLPILLLVFSCENILEAIKEGCTTKTACNYDADANKDDGSCLENDCASECGGDAFEDCAGVCGGNTVADCAGVCGGDATEDDCGVCDGNNADLDCEGVCFGSASLDACGNCSNEVTVFPFCEGYSWDYHVEVYKSSYSYGNTSESTQSGDITMIVETFNSSTGVAKLKVTGDLNYSYFTLNSPIYVREINGVLERSDYSNGPWKTALNPSSSSWTNGGLLFAGSPSYRFYLSSTSVTVPAGTFSGYKSKAEEDNWGESYTSDNHEYTYEEVFSPGIGLIYSKKYTYFNDTANWQVGPNIIQVIISLTDFGIDDPLECANSLTDIGAVDLNNDGSIDSCFPYQTTCNGSPCIYSLPYFLFKWNGGCLATGLEFQGQYYDISYSGETENLLLFEESSNFSEEFTIYFDNGTSSTITGTSTDCGTSGRQKVIPNNIILLGN